MAIRESGGERRRRRTRGKERAKERETNSGGAQRHCVFLKARAFIIIICI